MSGCSAPQLWYGQQPLHVATRPHNGVAPYQDTNFMIPTRSQLMNYGSSSGQSIPRRDPARNQRPGSPSFGRFHSAPISGPRVQSHLYGGFQPPTYPPPGPLRVAPGGNPYGHQKPGIMTVPSPRHRTYHHHPYRSGPYICFPHPPLGQQNNAGHQRIDLHSRTFHQKPGVPVPSTTDDLGFVFHELLPQSNCQSQTIAPPQDTQINEVAPTLIGGTTVLVPETTPPALFPGTQPAGAPTLYTKAPPEVEVSQPTKGTCPDPACSLTVSCGRQQELERHVLKHLPHHIYCPHPSCNWRGSRRYTLFDHFSKEHPMNQAPDRGSSDTFTIYDGKRLAKRLVNREVTLEEAIDEANASVRSRAVELAKWDMWNIQYK